MIRLFASAYRRGDYFTGRMSLFGRFGTLWPSGQPAAGQAVSFGMPGSGKSTAAAIPAVLLHDGPVLCFDPKGEITQRCFAARGAGGNGIRGRGDKTYIIDPANLTGLPKSRYNPLQEIYEETFTDDALRLMFKLAEGIVKTPDGDGGQNAWVYTGARDFAYGLIAFVVDCLPPELRNLTTVRRLLMEGDGEYYAALKFSGEEPSTPFDALLVRMTRERGGRFGDVIAGQAADVQKMGDRQRGSILKELSNATTWLDLPSFRETVCASDFRLRDFSRTRISLFVCLPLNELTGIASGFMRFFLTMFMQTMYRAPAPPKAGPVLCLVDEFPQFGNIDGFCRIGPTMRSYGVKLWILLQDISQLRNTYGRDLASSFLGCAAFVQYMAMKHDETIDELVRSLGERLIQERQPDGRTISRPYPLLDREQARRYLAARGGNQIIVPYDSPPLRLKTAPYFWFLPFWMYSPDPLHPEAPLRAWMRRRAVAKAAMVKTTKARAAGKEVGTHGIAG